MAYKISRETVILNTFFFSFFPGRILNMVTRQGALWANTLGSLGKYESVQLIFCFETVSSVVHSLWNKPRAPGMLGKHSSIGPCPQLLSHSYKERMCGLINQDSDSGLNNI